MLSLFPIVLRAQVQPGETMQYYHFYFTDTWDPAQLSSIQPLWGPKSLVPINCYKAKVAFSQPFSQSSSLNTVKYAFVCCCPSQTMKGFGFSGDSSFLWCQNTSCWKDAVVYVFLYIYICSSTIWVVCGLFPIKQGLGHIQCVRNRDLSCNRRWAGDQCHLIPS